MLCVEHSVGNYALKKAESNLELYLDGFRPLPFLEKLTLSIHNVLRKRNYCYYFQLVRNCFIKSTAIFRFIMIVNTKYLLFIFLHTECSERIEIVIKSETEILKKRHFLSIHTSKKHTLQLENTLS